MQSIFNLLFRVDYRTLGIFRILFGILCSFDLIRRWNYIDVFYSNQAIKTSFNKINNIDCFSIFYYSGNSSFNTHAIFLIGIIFSIFLIIGYKTKLSQFIIAIIIISVHTFATEVGNSGDTFLNSMLIWTLFLPLGACFSIDSIIKSLKNKKEFDTNSLNKDNIYNSNYFCSIAYFAVLLQISGIYFLTALNKSGRDWGDGIAFYKMHQLDGFITSAGYYLRDYINYPISKIFTNTTLYLEYIVPLLIFIPFYNHIFRLILFITLSIFHMLISVSMHVGLFSQTMITSIILLINTKTLDSIKNYFSRKYKNNKYILFYDSDCGFCHLSVRIIKRLDIYNRIIFANRFSEIEKPKGFSDLANKTAMLYNPINKKLWIRHQSFGKILSILPFGFLISWIFFIPAISQFLGLIYDTVAKYRTKISTLLSLPACNLPNAKIEEKIVVNNNFRLMIQSFSNHIIQITMIISPIMIIILLSGSIYSALITNPGIETYFKKKISWKNNSTLKYIIKKPRMIQNWKMFSPNVLSKDNLIILEVELSDGSIINPFTGKKPILNSTDYKFIMNNKSQLWRKYFENFKSHKYLHFKKWVLNKNNDYFKENLSGNEILSVNIWKVSQNSPRMIIKNGLFQKIKKPKEATHELGLTKKILKKNLKKDKTKHLIKNNKRKYRGRK